MVVTENIETREERMVREINEELRQNPMFEKDDAVKKMYEVFDIIVEAMDKNWLEDNYLNIEQVLPNDLKFNEKSEGTHLLLKQTTVEGMIAEFDDIYLCKVYHMTYEEHIELKLLRSAFAHIIRAIGGREMAKVVSQRARFRIVDEDLKEKHGTSARAYRYRLPRKFIELYIMKRKDLSSANLRDVVLP